MAGEKESKGLAERRTTNGKMSRDNADAERKEREDEEKQCRGRVIRAGG